MAKQAVERDIDIGTDRNDAPFEHRRDGIAADPGFDGQFAQRTFTFQRIQAMSRGEELLVEACKIHFVDASNRLGVRTRYGDLAHSNRLFVRLHLTEINGAMPIRSAIFISIKYPQVLPFNGTSFRFACALRISAICWRAGLGQDAASVWECELSYRAACRGEGDWGCHRTTVTECGNSNVSTERSSVTTVPAYTCKPSMAGRMRQPQG
ncbi:hypothetical protein [Cupriavidus nantongensis]